MPVGDDGDPVTDLKLLADGEAHGGRCGAEEVDALEAGAGGAEGAERLADGLTHGLHVLLRADHAPARVARPRQ